MCWFLVFATTVLLGLAYFLYSGLLYKADVAVKEKPLGGELEIYYKVGRGSHSSCSEYYDEMKELALQATRIGIFYDDPKLVRTSNLRWIVGVISAVNGERTVDEFVLERLKRYRCLSFTIPETQKAIVSEYPYNNSFSLWLARRKVYSQMQQFQKHSTMAGRPVIEILKENAVEFILPLQSHDMLDFELRDSAFCVNEEHADMIQGSSIRYIRTMNSLSPHQELLGMAASAMFYPVPSFGNKTRSAKLQLNFASAKASEPTL